MTKKKLLQMGGGDFVAWWDVRLSDGVHRIGFEHGTTTGRRVIRVDGKVSMTQSTLVSKHYEKF